MCGVGGLGSGVDVYLRVRVGQSLVYSEDASACVCVYTSLIFSSLSQSTSRQGIWTGIFRGPSRGWGVNEEATWWKGAAVLPVASDPDLTVGSGLVLGQPGRSHLQEPHPAQGT